METWLSFDIGMLNLAFVKAVVDLSEYTIKKIICVKHVNLTQLQHSRISRRDCKLYHSNDAHDRVQHFLQEFQDEFRDIDRVFMERQPIVAGAMCSVEQLLFGHFRDRAKLVSPNSMHKFFNIGHLLYDQRKIETTKIASPYFSHFLDWNSEERKHDMADAMCLMLFELGQIKKKEQKKMKSKAAMEQQILHNGNVKCVGDFFNQFKYQKKRDVSQFLQSAAV